MSTTTTLLFHDPGDRVKRGFDHSEWLAEDRDVIGGSTWSATPSEAGLTLTDPVFNETKAGITISGGVAGTQYRVTNHITTVSGQEKSRSFTVMVEDA